MTYSANWTAAHKYARILRNHNVYLGFWYGSDETGSEFAISLFGRTFHIWGRK